MYSAFEVFKVNALYKFTFDIDIDRLVVIIVLFAVFCRYRYFALLYAWNFPGVVLRQRQQSIKRCFCAIRSFYRRLQLSHVFVHATPISCPGHLSFWTPSPRSELSWPSGYTSSISRDRCSRNKTFCNIFSEESVCREMYCSGIRTQVTGSPFKTSKQWSLVWVTDTFRHLPCFVVVIPWQVAKWSTGVLGDTRNLS